MDKCELKKGSSFKGDLSVSDKNGSSKKSAKKRPLSPCYEDDGLTITTVKHRQDETPSPPRGNPSVEKPQESDDDNLIVIDDRDGPDSRTGSLLLVKRRKIAHGQHPQKISGCQFAVHKNSERFCQNQSVPAASGTI